MYTIPVTNTQGANIPTQPLPDDPAAVIRFTGSEYVIYEPGDTVPDLPDDQLQD